MNKSLVIQYQVVFNFHLCVYDIPTSGNAAAMGTVNGSTNKIAGKLILNNNATTVLSTSLDSAHTSRYHFLLSLDFYEFWSSVMSICLLTEVKQQFATFVLTWVTSCHQTFVNSSALLVSLIALHSRNGTKTPFGLVTKVFIE